MSQIKQSKIDTGGLGNNGGSGNGHECPSCKSKTRMNAHGVFCTNDGCEFKLWRKVAGKSLSDKTLETLLTRGISGKVKGLKGSKGTFDCRLQLTETGKVTFKFD